MNGRSETGKDDAARSRTAKVFDARDDGAFRGRIAWALNVCRIGEESKDTLIAITSERRDVKAGSVNRCVVNLEIAGVNDDAKWSAHGKRDAVNRAVRDGDEFDFVWTDFNAAARNDFAQRGGIQQAGFFEALFDQRECETRAKDRNIEIAKDVRKRADVIFVSVGENDGADEMTILLEVGDVRNDKVNAEELGFREHHTGVYDDDVVAEAKRHHVHAKFAETAEGNCEKRLRRLAQ